MNKTNTTVLIICFAFTALVHSGEQNQTILSSKNGLHLTHALLETAIDIELILDQQTQMSPDERETIKASLIEEFNADPKETINSTPEVAADLGVKNSNQKWTSTHCGYAGE